MTTTPSSPTCAILSIGNELLEGFTLDTNAHWLCTEMGLDGWTVSEMRTIDDSHDAIATTLGALTRNVGVVLVTGGLGPTEDDCTRQAVASCMNAPLREREELIREIEARFRRFQRPMRPSNRVQAMIPEGADGLSNPCGTAPGIHAQINNAQVFCMPGVPSEMREMFRGQVKPRLPHLSGQLLRRIRRLHLHGIGESNLGEVIRPLMKEDANPRIGTNVGEGIITLRLVASATSPEAAESLLDNTEKELRAQFSEAIYGTDGQTLADALVTLLRERKETLATAESCTGGWIAKTITDIAGSSDIFGHAFVTYANEAKTRWLDVPESLLQEHGAVSPEVVSAMARGARRATGATYALACSGIAGPGGGTDEKPTGTIWIALAAPDGARTACLHLPYDREGNRIRTVYAALDLLRRTICGYPYPWEVRHESE